MSSELPPGLERDLVAARAALARHGVVIIRTVESELEPAVMAAVRGAMASSGKNLSKLDESALDSLMDDARKAVRDSSEDLQKLYTRLLAKLGAEDIRELLPELEGMDQLFRWDRVLRAAEAVNPVLAGRGFPSVQLSGPEELSDAFKLELEERWPAAIAEFRTIAEAAAKELARNAEKPGQQEQVKPQKRRKR